MEYEKDTEDVDTDADILEDAREKFLLCVEKEKDNRDIALDDVKFGLLGEQWPDQAKHDREKEGRPCLTINKFPAYIRQVVNDARQNKPTIRVRPVDDNADPQTAEVINGLIRNIETVSKADIAYDTAIQQTASSGFGFIRVNIDYADDDTFDQDISIDRIPNQFTVYGDPESTSADGSDWECCYVTDRITKDEFCERYPDAKADDFDIEGGAVGFEWENDDGIWIAEYWEKEEVPRQICMLSDGSVVDESVYEEQAEFYAALGVTKTQSRETKSCKVTQYIISGSEVLERNEWPGRHIPIIPVYGEEVVVEGKRYFKSLVRDSKDSQKMYNYWRTASTELVALAPKAPFIGEEGAFDIEPDKWASANAKSYAYLQHKRGTAPPQRQPFAGVPAGILQESMSASNDLEATMGMFGASIGQEDNAVSGKAIIARQRESDTGTFHFIDNLSRSLRRAGEIILDLIPHIYTPGRIIRVLGEDRKESQNVQLAQEGQQADFESIYDLTVGKYDVTVEIGPGFTTKRQEAASQMVELMRVNPAFSQISMDLLAKNLDWPGADEIADRAKALLPPQIAGENPQIQQLQQALQQTQAQAQQITQQLQQEIQKIQADKAIDMEKVKIDAYNAETNRFKVAQVGMSPEQVQQLVIQTLQQLLQTPDITPGAEQVPPVMAQPEVMQ